MMVCKVTWHTPMRSGNSNKKRKFNAFVRRIELFKSGEFDILWDEFIKEWEVQQLLIAKQAAKDDLNAQRTDYYSKLESKRAKVGIYYARNSDLSGGMRAMTSFGVLPLTDENKQLIRDLHPHEDELKIDPEIDYKDIDPLVLNVDSTLKAIQRYKITTGAGADGFKLLVIISRSN